MKPCLLLIILLLTFGRTAAQSNYMFFHISLQDGLSDARVTAIHQDKIGFMWFGTPNGLNRYDGYSIKTFYAGVQSGLPSNNVRAIYSDIAGRLWVATSKGVAAYNFAKQRFESTWVNDFPKNTSVFCFSEDRKGNVFVGTERGIFRYEANTGKWENFSEVLNLRTKLIKIKSLVFLNQDLLFATTEKKGFYRINIRTKEVKEFGMQIGSVYECCLSMFGMERLNDHELLIGTLSFGLLKFNTITNTFSHPKGILKKRKGILFNSVSQIKKDHAGRFWVASYYSGLAEYLPGQDSVVEIGRDTENPYGFEGNNAYSLYEDRQHNIWIGTILNGIFHFNPNRKSVQFHFGGNESKGLQQGKVMSLAALDSNTLMVGTDVGPSIYTKHNNHFQNFKGAAFNFGNKALEQVSAGLKDRKGTVWMASSRLGLMRYHLGSTNIQVFGRYTKPIPFEDDGISDMLELPGDSLMVIGYGRIAFFNTKTYKSQSFRTDSAAPLFKLDNVLDICFDKDKMNVWLSVAPAKLYKYNMESKQLFEMSSLINTPTPPSAIYKIAFDSQNRLWCATNVGAVCLVPGGAAKVYSISNGNAGSLEIKNILPYEDHVWITNDRSLASLNLKSEHMTILGERDGFSGVQLFGNSLIRSPWNTILIGSNYGFYEIDPLQVVDESTASAAYLTSFKVYDKPLATDSAISTLTQIKLAYNQNFFSFDFSPFDYSEANDLEYAYMLQGFDQNWVNVGKLRSGSYTNVPGGKYVLRLRVKNSTGVWNESSQQVTIVIAHAFWETWWFFGIIASLLLGVGYFIYRKRISFIRKQATLRSDYEIKMNELENSALRSQMNPHFIFNSLNTINSFINKNEPANANQYISKFSKLIRLILDHSREKTISLAEEMQVLSLYIALERIRFEYKFEVEISIDADLDPDNTELPSLIIQPFVENAILHGLLPLKRPGLLKVDVLKHRDHLLLVIEDNGVGRKLAGETKRFADENRKSHGLDITLKRIKLFNAEHEFNANSNVIDKKDAMNIASGTRIEIPIAWEERF